MTEGDVSKRRFQKRRFSKTTLFKNDAFQKRRFQKRRVQKRRVQKCRVLISQPEVFFSIGRKGYRKDASADDCLV